MDQDMMGTATDTGVRERPRATFNLIEAETTDPLFVVRGESGMVE